MEPSEPAGYPRRRDVRGADRAPADPSGRSAGQTTLAPHADRLSIEDRPPRRTSSATPEDEMPAMQARAPRGSGASPAPRRGAVDDLALMADGDDGRGRHATGRGDGFGRLVGLTILGAAIPGTGFLAAGRRRIGWLVLVPVLFLVGAVGAVVLSGRALSLARQEVFKPQSMLYLAIGVVVVALLWCAVIAGSHLALRRERLTRPQRLLSLLLVTALMALVVVPSATAARYAVADRDLLINAFGQKSGSTKGLDKADTARANPWAGIPRVNILLVGADSSQGHIGTRPDSVMVASVNTRTGDTVLFGLSRNLELKNLTFPGNSALTSAWDSGCSANGGTEGCFLNAAYLFGVQHPALFPGATDSGLEATRAAASALTGLKIDYEAMVNLDGFEDLVSAMGGIKITVTHTIDIGGGQILNNRNEPTGRNYPVTGTIPPGVNEELNGYQAEWYVRSRWPLTTVNNDIRMERQRCFINAAVQQYSVTKLAKAFPALASAAEKDFATDITTNELNAFVDLGMTIKKGSGLRTVLFNTTGGTDTGKPNVAALQAQVKAALDPPAARPSGSSSAPARSSATPSAPAPAPAASASSAPSSQGESVSSVCPAP